MSSDSTERALGELILILGKDFERLQRRMETSAKRGNFTETDESYARSLIRALFALVEGTCNAIKVDALGKLLDSGSVQPEVVNVTMEQRFDLDDKGRIVQRSLTYTWDKNVRFAFAQHALAYRCKNWLDPSQEWWSALVAVSKVRDRLMHPKRPEDLDLVPSDVVCCIRAKSGFFTTVLMQMKSKA